MAIASVGGTVGGTVRRDVLSSEVLDAET